MTPDEGDATAIKRMLETMDILIDLTIKDDAESTRSRENLTMPLLMDFVVKAILK